jgi:hypothetical protein
VIAPLFLVVFLLAFAKADTGAAAVLVDEFDAGYFPSRRSPTRIIGQKDEIGFVLTQGTKIVNLRRDSARRS